VTDRTGAGLAAAVRVVRLMVRVVAVPVCTEVSDEAGADVLISGAGASSSGGGCVPVDGAGSVVTGCVCGAASWASTDVEESAKAAAIAGQALVRA
jgi:hypothetical protein